MPQSHQNFGMKPKEILKFSMVFEDGEKFTRGMEINDPNISNEDLIMECNRTNPKHWGDVVEIIDRRKVTVMVGGRE